MVTLRKRKYTTHGTDFTSHLTNNLLVFDLTFDEHVSLLNHLQQGLNVVLLPVFDLLINVVLEERSSTANRYYNHTVETYSPKDVPYLFQFL